MKRLAAFAALLFAGCHCAPCISDSVHAPGPCCDSVGAAMAAPTTTYKQVGYSKSMGGTIVQHPVQHPVQHAKGHVSYGHSSCGHPGCGPVCCRPLACLSKLLHCGGVDVDSLCSLLLVFWPRSRATSCGLKRPSCILAL